MAGGPFRLLARGLRGLRGLVRALDPSVDEQAWSMPWYMSKTASGIDVSQVSALSSAAVYCCVVTLAEDVSKIKPIFFRPRRGAPGRDLVESHWLPRLLRRPNNWQTHFDFTLMLMTQLLLRSNAYAVIIRDATGRPIRLVPVNSDRVALWESPNGDLFYRVTPLGLHESAQLKNEPFLIPAEDIFHVRGLSLNGVLGSARMVLGKEAIGLDLAYQQQAAHWMSSGSRPSGVLSTDQKLTAEAARRMASDWRDTHSGLQNSGKVAVLEEGLKYHQIAFSALDMEFIRSRQYQLEDLARMFRIPLHMISTQNGKGSTGTVEQQAAEYLNYTLASYTVNIGEKIAACFDLDGEGLVIDWDYSALTRADRSARVAMYARAVAGGIWTQNEARLDDGLNPEEGGDRLWMPTNVAYAGSQTNGQLPDGGGRPPGSPNAETIVQ